MARRKASRGLPVALEAAPRPSLARTSPQAEFLSQLIAERYHLATQRARRRAPVSEALDSYDSGTRVSERRMPAGYRTTIIT
jgi:hypothetical protein